MEHSYPKALSVDCRSQSITMVTGNPKVTVSLGVTTMVPRSKVLHTELIEAADSALYDAKRDGRDCIRTSGVALRRDEDMRARSHVA